jgi:predicted esterase
MTLERTLPVTIHGRYLVAGDDTAAPLPLLIGFHGYAENAETQLGRLSGIPGSDRWRLVSVQGVHRFYRGRSTDVVASWMTRQDRELMIADNVAYVSGVIAAVARDWPGSNRLVLAGFSQGVATTFRSACIGPVRPRGVIVLGGDVPPELDRERLARIPSALIGRGEADEWYSQEKFDSDVARLRAANVDVHPAPFEGGHEWTPAFNRAAGDFLARL